MNKADPFGDTASHEEAASGSEPTVAEPAVREDEPVEADHVGALLCATRMRAGGDLQEIAKILRIRYGYLVAIEDGRHEDLPGSAYSIGFIRAYSDYLGLDGNEVVRRLREETNGTVTTARFKFPTPSRESGLPNGGLLAIAVSMGLVVYGSWYAITNSDRDAVDIIQEVPDRLAVLINDQERSVASGSAMVEENAPFQSQADDSPVTSDDAGDPIIPSAVVAASQGSEDVQEDSGGEVPEPLGIEGDIPAVIETSETTLSPNEGPDVSAESTSAGEQSEVVERSQTVQVSEERQLTGADELKESVPAEVVAEITETSTLSVREPDTEDEASADGPSESDETVTDQTMSVTAIVDESVDSESPNDVSIILATEDAEVENALEIERGVESDDVPADAIETPAQVAEAVDSAETETEAVDSEGVERAAVVEVQGSESPRRENAVEASNPEVALSVEPTIIELRAKSDSWIQVRDGDELLLTRLLREGEVYRVPDRDGLTLMTGNAGGLEVFVGGEQVPPLGDEGAVRRGVPLNAERLRTGVAP